MSFPGAIVISAGLIAGALLLGSHGHTQTAVGRYRVATSGADGSTAWVLDTTSGELRHCSYTAAGKPGIVCRGTQ